MKTKVFMMLRLFRNCIGMSQHYFYHILYNGFCNIGFIRSCLIVHRLEVLSINTQVQQLQSNYQSYKTDDMFFNYLHRTIRCKLQTVCFGGC